MGSDDLTPLIFFVCGTPSDRHGFDYITLDEGRLPARLDGVLDSIQKSEIPERGTATYFVYRDESEGWSAYAEYRSIHPNDTAHNRGAYIAVGCCTETPLRPDQAQAALSRIEAVHDDLASKRHLDTNTFGRDFQLRAYVAPSSVAALDPAEVSQIQLADLFCQAAAGRGTYSGEFGKVILTSKDIEESQLAWYCTPLPTSEEPRVEAVAPNSQIWHARLLEIMQEARYGTPQTRQALRRLSEVEKERRKIIDSLSRIASNEVQKGQQIGIIRYQSRSWRWLRSREFIFALFGIIIGIAITLITTFIVKWISS